MIVKIGYTKSDPVKRLKTLQTGNHEHLSILGVAPGGVQDERAIHQRCSMSRLAGEWFSFDGLVPLVVGNLLGWGKSEMNSQQVESARKMMECDLSLRRTSSHG